MLGELFNLPRPGPEISDAIVDFDADTLARRPVAKAALAARFAAAGNRAAARIVGRIPARGEYLDERAVDRLLIAAHCEMQRLSEEFDHGRRVAGMLGPLVAAIRGAGPPARRIRVVDIGCGTGFVLRWLAAHGGLADVELVGADLNPALVAEAARLARAENLDCRFTLANAFRLDQPADVYLSTGILHHFRGAALAALFARQNLPETRAFVHFDFARSVFAPFGSWLFHRARMRTALARHDGVLSAMRAHAPADLLAAARAGAPDFASALYGVRLWGTPVPRVFHALVGLRPGLREDFRARLGRRRLWSLGVAE